MAFHKPCLQKKSNELYYNNVILILPAVFLKIIEFLKD